MINLHTEITKPHAEMTNFRIEMVQTHTEITKPHTEMI